MDSVHKLLRIKLHDGKLTPETQGYLEDSDPEVRKEALRYVKQVPSDVLKRLVHDDDDDVALLAIHHPDAYEPHLVHALQSNSPTVHAAIANHPKISSQVLDRLLDSVHTPVEVKMLALRNKHLSPKLLDKAIKKLSRGSSPDDKRLLIQAAGHPATLDSSIVHIINATPKDHTAAVSATFLKSPVVLLELANEEHIPLSLKKILLLNHRFDANNWWKLKDPHLRAMKQEEEDAG